VSDLVDIYVALILAGRKTLEQVPASLRAAVEAKLNA